MSFYFEKYEDRVPEPPLAHNEYRELLWQFLAVMALTVGAWYIFWRWTSSLNYDALWYAVPLVVAETGAYIGLMLFTFNLWKVKDTPKKSPPTNLSEVVSYKPQEDRPINVDMYFTTLMKALN
jgi:cellulose synthase (UDP-forming)